MPHFRKTKLDYQLFKSKEDWLSARELERFPSGSAKIRQLNWAGGRYAAKSLIQEFCLHQRSPKPELNEIEILSGSQGEPLVNIQQKPRSDVSLSISHRNGTGFAGLSQLDTEGRIGVDVEHIHPLNHRLAQRILNPAEIETLHRKFPKNDELGLILFWALKEAAYKCVRPLIGAYRRDFTISLHPGERSARIALAHRSRIEHLQAHYEIEGDYCFCSAIAAPPVIKSLAQH